VQSARSLAMVWVLLLLTFAPAANATQPVPDTGAVEQHIAEAIARDLHLELPPNARLQVLIPLTILPANVEVRVVSLKPAFTPATWLVRLACAPSRDCLPFHALLSGCHPTGSLAGTSAVFGPHSATGAARSAAVAGWVTTSGERVELTGGDSQITVKVKAVCLEAGRLGDTVRVRALGSNRIVSATVVGDRLVRVKP
jgi:Chaperone for flagella basal body P-ring formation